MAELLDRDLYWKIKRMDRKEMEAIMQDFYKMGRERTLRKAVQQPFPR